MRRGYQGTVTGLDHDVIIAGCGISGLLLGSQLAGRCRLLMLEQEDSVPRDKYWLTSRQAKAGNPRLARFVDSEYDHMDFVAYDGTSARITGEYCLWDTDGLTAHLTDSIRKPGASILTGHRFYSYRRDGNRLVVRANDKSLSCRLLVDCMGYRSPLITAKNVVSILGYFLLHGRLLAGKALLHPIGLHNVMVQSQPTYLELFPTREGLVHATMIVPTRQIHDHVSIENDFEYIIGSSHYSRIVEETDESSRRAYSGVIPVGRLRRHALDRIFFYGEAGQVNPATSATGMTRMLCTHKKVAAFLLRRLEEDRLDSRSLRPRNIPYMPHMIRLFQECLFESLLGFNSDDFKRLVLDMARYDDAMVYKLVFAEGGLPLWSAARVVADAVLRPRGILGRHILRALLRSFYRR